jgi:hypothetical protein
MPAAARIRPPAAGNAAVLRIAAGSTRTSSLAAVPWVATAFPATPWCADRRNILSEVVMRNEAASVLRFCKCRVRQSNGCQHQGHHARTAPAPFCHYVPPNI